VLNSAIGRETLLKICTGAASEELPEGMLDVAVLELTLIDAS
jgi:hypothetical protein